MDKTIILMLFPLTNEEKNRLQKLNNDKAIIFALKKLLLNTCVANPSSNEAITKITQAFHNLEMIQSASKEEKTETNLI